MSYQIPQHIDKNKIFIVNRSEIEGRLEPSIYRCAFKFISNIYPNVRLSDVAYINPKVSFNNMRNDDFISFIPMGNIDEQNGEVVKCDSLRVQEAKGYVKFIENDLLWAKITPCMQNGKSAIARNLVNGVGCGSTEFHVVRPKNKAVLIEYIHFLLHSNKILETAKNYFGGSAGQQRVPSFFLEHFSTPLPPLKVQKDIVKKIKEAKNLKKEKECEAQQLLDSIDDYLLEELGIKLPEYHSDLNNRIFYVQHKELTNRIDPYYSQQYFKNSFEAICSGKYPIDSLGKLSVLITSGITPKSGGSAYTEDQINGIPFIRSGNINVSGDLDYNELLYLKPEIHNTIMRSSQVHTNDIMIAIVGATIGQVGIYLSDREANINQAIALVRLKQGIDVQYVKELIKSKIGQISLNRLKRPVARANINLEEIATIQVVVPPLNKQHEIAKHIKEIRKQAKMLQEEGKAILENAKREIERMIIGE